MTVDPIPVGYPRVIPYLAVDGAADAIAFYVSVLGARERMRMPGPNGRIGHAELEIGDSVVMLADASPQGGPSPREIGGSPVTVMVYVPDVDAAYAAAIEAGAQSLIEPKNQFYGDRAAAFTDPFGHRWHIASHVEDVSPEEMDRRMKQAMGG
ncbi:MAG: VOC family protein [Pseudonocardiales bacterium]|nr:VOC family protein [Pseudonocardiales bacterium]